MKRVLTILTVLLIVCAGCSTGKPLVKRYDNPDPKKTTFHADKRYTHLPYNGKKKPSKKCKHMKLPKHK